MGERVTEVAEDSYAVDRISEAIRECESQDPNTERAAHLLRAALRAAFGAEPRPADPATERERDENG